MVYRPVAPITIDFGNPEHLRSRSTMKSPFPGMDPYLELNWGDVHTSLIVYARNQLNPQLPADLLARVEESGQVTIDDDESPVQRHIEIVDTSNGNRLVTAIELLSPANRTGYDGVRAYRRKQREYLEAGVNLVEIDLVRQGDFVLAAPIDKLPKPLRRANAICVRRAARPDEAEFFPAPLEQSLPNVPVPLRAGDADAVLRLQPLVDDCYRDGRYDRLDYSQTLTPPLSHVQAAWVRDLLGQRSP